MNKYEQLQKIMNETKALDDPDEDDEQPASVTDMLNHIYIYIN